MSAIRNRNTNAVLYETDGNPKETVEAAVASRADLFGANLYRAQITAEQVRNLLAALRVVITEGT